MIQGFPMLCLCSKYVIAYYYILIRVVSLLYSNDVDSKMAKETKCLTMYYDL